jgi:DNA repair protein RadC
MKEILILNEPLGRITNPKDIFKKIKKIKIDYNQENFLVFYLNTPNQVKKKEVLFKGGLNSCLIDPKTIFRKCLIYNCSQIIIAHNHPSNDLHPSYEDKEIFNKLKEIGNILDLKVLDSIIFNKKEFYSLNN